MNQNGFNPGLNESQYITFVGLAPNIDQFQIYWDPSGAPAKVGEDGATRRVVQVSDPPDDPALQPLLTFARAAMREARDRPQPG